MARLIRMDTTGHSTLAEWTAGDHEAIERAVAEFRRELDSGYYAMVTEGEGHARQVTELPLDAELAAIVARVIEQNPDVAERVRAGNPKAIGALVGPVMRETKGRADGAEVTRIVREKLGV